MLTGKTGETEEEFGRDETGSCNKSEMEKGRLEIEIGEVFGIHQCCFSVSVGGGVRERERDKRRPGVCGKG